MREQNRTEQNKTKSEKKRKEKLLSVAHKTSTVELLCCARI